jgi:hypothetical protein
MPSIASLFKECTDQCEEQRGGRYPPSGYMDGWV